MIRCTSRSSSPRSQVETLECRKLLSAAVAGPLVVVSELTPTVVVANAASRASTKTTLTAVTGTLGQPIAFTVSVRAAAAAGAPQGTVNITDHGKLLATLTLSSTTSTNAKYATSGATYTLTQPIGGSAYFFGKHSVTASYIPSGSFSKSTGTATFTVAQPSYLTLTDGVKIASVVSGSGAELQSGQTGNVLYTGYLASNGHIFDDSINDGGNTFAVILDSGGVITGFNDGVTGMRAGETRIVRIPPAEGYGSRANGGIPGHSTLIFVITLESIT